MSGMVDDTHRISGVMIHETALFLMLSVAPLAQKKTVLVATACTHPFLDGKANNGNTSNYKHQGWLQS